MKKKRIISLALAAALILALGTAAYAIYNWRLQDLVLHSNAENETEVTESQRIDPLPEGVDTLSLQGYAGSPEYKAMLEWSEFQKNYDRDGEIEFFICNDRDLDEISNLKSQLTEVSHLKDQYLAELEKLKSREQTRSSMIVEDREMLKVLSLAARVAKAVSTYKAAVHNYRETLGR